MTDLISRQAAIDALNKEIIKRRLLDDVNDGMLDEFDTEDILRKLPSSEPKKGEWEKYYIDYESFGKRPSIFYCSECGACSTVKTDYCPNCGKDMERT